MSDNETTVQELRNLVDRFVAERSWQKHHAPKNLSMALAIEAAELMEHFQWLDVDASRDIVHDTETLQAVGEELADVVCYAIALANTLKLDLSTTIAKKMRKNELKYPVSEELHRNEP
ncbi:MAG: nucleotide pyrophosphohydrolase [Planctomycetota bacterium]|nr:nucleotide pyrophosphohydrolase [Planctomycetota bacterium]MDA1178052.1 nucleotide pyrophosphohydrolase [Planctomycetota bacterium]